LILLHSYSRHVPTAAAAAALMLQHNYAFLAAAQHLTDAD
jgi:hypothetical protein